MGLLEFVLEITVPYEKAQGQFRKSAIEKMKIRFIITSSIQDHSVDSVASLQPFNYSPNLEHIQEGRMKEL